MRHPQSWATVVAWLGGSAFAEEILNCGLLGPAYPIPTSLSSLKTITDAKDAFAASLRTVISTGSTDLDLPFDNVTTTFSVGVFSAHSDDFLFKYHYAAPALNETLTGGTLGDDTIYRIGSITKVLTVYTMLAKLGTRYLDEPITKFIPELANVTARDKLLHAQWSEVTLGAVAGQMAGLTRDGTSFPTA
jgi:CubicO group peptidase (beta-lactamase class C family)